MESTIHIKNLTKQFGNFIAVDDISFEVYKGEIFGFLGANGAGKTTVIRMLCGLLKPTSGSGKVAGFDILKESERIKQNIGYMSQRFTLYDDLTIKENIYFYGTIYGLSNLTIQNEMMKLISRLDIRKELNSLVKTLPLGWKQKLAFSIAVIHHPQIVFLDEPTSGVDPITRRQFWELIYETAATGITIFVSTHYMDEAEYCNRISIMVDGKIKVISEPEALKIRYQVETIDQVFYLLARESISL